MNNNVEKLLVEYMCGCEQIHDKYDIQYLKKLKLLYHFTNGMAFEKIIQQRKLLFTDYKGLNDKLELIYAKEIIKPMIARLNQVFQMRFLEIFEVFFQAMDLKQLLIAIS